ncbi:MAG: T9SS type A sorting domain-containing protein, partial [Candidatus Kapaibacteriota bacterium]
VVDTPSPISINVFDVFGRRVMNIFEGKSFSGHQAIQFRTDGLASGTYNVVFSIDGKSILKQISILK